MSVIREDYYDQFKKCEAGSVEFHKLLNRLLQRHVSHAEYAHQHGKDYKPYDQSHAQDQCWFKKADDLFIAVLRLFS